MLVEFKVENFKNFKDELRFRLDNIKNYEFSLNAIKNNIVKTAHNIEKMYRAGAFDG